VIDPELGRDHRRHPRRPVDPGIALVPGEPEHLRHGLGPVDQLTFHALQANPPLLGFEHLVRSPRLYEGPHQAHTVLERHVRNHLAKLAEIRPNLR
jgi:hypothetical protein